MELIIKLWGQLRSVAEQESFTVHVSEAATLNHVLQKIANETLVELAPLLLNEDGQCRQSTLIFINDEQVYLNNEQNLKSGMTITLMSPIAGG